MTTPTTETSKLSFTLRRLKKFIKTFTSNKRGILGVGILVFYSFVALAAPLLTPQDPVAETFVAGDYAVPAWFKLLPGGEQYSENLQLETQVGFPTEETLQEWKFTSTTSTIADVSLEYASEKGLDGTGAAVIVFKRGAGTTQAGIVKATLSKVFQYPYQGPPKRFSCDVAILASNVESLRKIDVRVFLIRTNKTASESYPLWVYPLIATPATWVTPSPKIDSYQSTLKISLGGSFLSNPAQIVFSQPANYTYRVDVSFDDSNPAARGTEVVSNLYIDDLNLKLYGTAYGVLGTDQQGRNILSQLFYGARISLFVGLLSAIMSIGLGLGLGLVAGYLGRIVDEILMRFTDMLLVIPNLPLLLVLIAVLGPSIWNLILLIGVLGWMGFARVVRSQVLSLRERPFVEAAKAVGAGKFHIITKHVLPNVMSLVYVSLAMAVPGAILAEAALSWLGLYDPRVMSWGRMLYDAQSYEGIDKPWWIIPPGISIAVVSLSFVLLGYALDEVLNPKLRQRR